MDELVNLLVHNTTPSKLKLCWSAYIGSYPGSPTLITSAQQGRKYVGDDILRAACCGHKILVFVSRKVSLLQAFQCIYIHKW